MLAAAIVGTISPSGKEVGPFLSIEQAILPQTIDDRHRTVIFAGYILVGSIAGAVGALAVGLPVLFSLSPISGYRFLIWVTLLVRLRDDPVLLSVAVERDQCHN